MNHLVATAAPGTVSSQIPDGQITTAQRKLRGSALLGRFFSKACNPKCVYEAIRLQVGRKSQRHSMDDAQLALYSKIVPGDFLHFGYFDDPHRRPEEMGLIEINIAQNRYADLLLDLAGPADQPALDVGCGMGGLSRMLRARGFSVVAITPDRLQVAHVRATQPDVTVVRSKLEQLLPSDYPNGFGTIFTAESLQYLKLDQALPILGKLIQPGGKWVACDFFHSSPSADRSCHHWDTFVEKLNANGWRIAYERDITAHVLPTLAYMHMWAVRFGVPLMQFAFIRLRRKQPGLHHLLGGVLHELEGVVNKNVNLIDPVQFADGKRYMLLAMERIDQPAAA